APHRMRYPPGGTFPTLTKGGFRAYPGPIEVSNLRPQLRYLLAQHRQLGIRRRLGTHECLAQPGHLDHVVSLRPLDLKLRSGLRGPVGDVDGGGLVGDPPGAPQRLGGSLAEHRNQGTPSVGPRRRHERFDQLYVHALARCPPNQGDPRVWVEPPAVERVSMELVVARRVEVDQTPGPYDPHYLQERLPEEDVML